MLYLIEVGQWIILYLWK